MGIHAIFQELLPLLTHPIPFYYLTVHTGSWTRSLYILYAMFYVKITWNITLYTLISYSVFLLKESERSPFLLSKVIAPWTSFHSALMLSAVSWELSWKLKEFSSWMLLTILCICYNIKCFFFVNLPVIPLYLLSSRCLQWFYCI